ncbi:MAG: fructosamine kinase family protein, partial [Bifidobacteriales bacterium]|nr:fructosamine kinase family protein [Bifidobacteriales bacterium]
MVRTYRKTRGGAPAGFFECEGLGLRWLGQAQSVGGPRVVDVYDWGGDFLDIEEVESTSPNGGAAYRFGAQLARMHDAGADHFGSAPDGYTGTCYFGPLQD